MRATTSGCEIVWPEPIGSGTLSHASAGEVRRDELLARDGLHRLHHPLVGYVRAELVEQPVPVGFHAITPPAARTSASARSESPSLTSTPRTAVESTVT